MASAGILLPATHIKNGGGSLHTPAQRHPEPAADVDRSVEFLSAARTALRISQQRHRQRRRQHEHLADDGGDYDGDDNGIPPLPGWLADLDPSNLTLYRGRSRARFADDDDGDADDGGGGRCDDARTLVSDARSLLKLLDSHLADLHGLVRRRGHTNDPTIEIQSLMEKFEEGAREVRDVCDMLRNAGSRPPPPRDDEYGMHSLHPSSSSSSQRRKHYEMLSSQLEAQAKERTDALRGELETRSRVLREQSHRRRMLASGGGAIGVGVGAGGGGISESVITSSAGARTAIQHPTMARLPVRNDAAAASSQFQSPLFTATSGGKVAAAGFATTATARRNTPSSSSSSSFAASSSYPAYAGYGGSAPTTTTTAVGYGGASSMPAMGMRHRRHHAPGEKSRVQIDGGGGDDDRDDKYDKSSPSGSSMQMQISQRRERRATHARAQQARLAERSITELGVMFTKMSTLISQQGEVLERIEDDVEAAGMDIDAGHDELVKVYGMTKGNRGLILKVFGILIFLIIFMKLY
jgi:hypothetical protein